MARAEAPQHGLMPSMLDRLIDPDTTGTVWRHGYAIEQVIDAVRRDLEDLLNTHQSYVDFPEEWEELRNSVFLYGMPDLVSFSATEHAALASIVEAIIKRFEPRLREVRVVVGAGDVSEDQRARLHIEARLNVDPAPEVAFETVVELTTGHASIKASEPLS